ncbi:hypothetical protein CJ255_18880 [Candidatus Viridilinea mediisalina]|uniref:Uncharacterized protein n=1 Tax=Candidatus Viridilinea mediisalina TaxID=2024553 RepID=A0A2A6REK9_9CHLR|nr:hypothetical protein CJ255_18880 [Candidatus Viridilinea mediisalina]
MHIALVEPGRSSDLGLLGIHTLTMMAAAAPLHVRCDGCPSGPGGIGGQAKNPRSANPIFGQREFVLGLFVFKSQCIIVRTAYYAWRRHGAHLAGRLSAFYEHILDTASNTSKKLYR